jgi:predicted nucleic-acid-binding protein
VPEVIAIDTNVLVRIAVSEQEAESSAELQRQKAQALFRSGKELFVPVTVVQELEWVLRAVYEMPVNEIAAFFEDLLCVENIRVDRSAAVAQSISLYRSGFDFSDALHWAQSGLCESFLTFDQKFLKTAASIKLELPVARVS